MSRARKRRFYRRRKAPFLGRFLRRTLGIEQICDECSKPYLQKPTADPIDTFVVGSAVASVFIEHSFGRKRFHVSLGRNRSNGNEMLISQFLSEENLEDIARAAFQARRFIREQKVLRQTTPRRHGPTRKQASRR